MQRFKAILMAIALTFGVVTIAPTAAGALAQGSRTAGTCSVSYGVGYNTWFGNYQASVSSGDTDCNSVRARVQTNSGLDTNYYYSVYRSRSTKPTERYLIEACGSVCKGWTFSKNS